VTTRALLVALAAPCALLALAVQAHAAPPAGQSARLNGMHDMESADFMKGATPGCDEGWITDLQYIGDSGRPGANCHAAAIAEGISIIQRLDVDGAQSFPKDPAKAPGYASAFASFASQCPDIHVWIVGNDFSRFQPQGARGTRGTEQILRSLRPSRPSRFVSPVLSPRTTLMAGRIPVMNGGSNAKPAMRAPMTPTLALGDHHRLVASS